MGFLDEGKIDIGLPVTQPDDPPSGGHFSFGTSKAPLKLFSTTWNGQ